MGVRGPHGPHLDEAHACPRARGHAHSTPAKPPPITVTLFCSLPCQAGAGEAGAFPGRLHSSASGGLVRTDRTPTADRARPVRPRLLRGVAPAPLVQEPAPEVRGEKPGCPEGRGAETGRSGRRAGVRARRHLLLPGRALPGGARRGCRSRGHRDGRERAQPGLASRTSAGSRPTSRIFVPSIPVCDAVAAIDLVEHIDDGTLSAMLSGMPPHPEACRPARHLHARPRALCRADEGPRLHPETVPAAHRRALHSGKYSRLLHEAGFRVDFSTGPGVPLPGCEMDREVRSHRSHSLVRGSDIGSC